MISTSPRESYLALLNAQLASRSFYLFFCPTSLRWLNVCRLVVQDYWLILCPFDFVFTTILLWTGCTADTLTCHSGHRCSNDCCIPLRRSPAIAHAGSLALILGHVIELSPVTVIKSTCGFPAVKMSAVQPVQWNLWPGWAISRDYILLIVSICARRTFELLL